MRKQLEAKLQRFEELEALLVDPEVLGDSSRLSAVAREHGSLAKLATKYRRFKDLNVQIAEAMEMAEGPDPELRELAEAELPALREEREGYWNELLDLTIGGDDAARTRCVLEIRAGTGGEEAALFARDLYEMYKHYADDQGWKTEILNMNPTELGGFKELIVGLEGEGVYRHMQYESGGHRVQRVPETESQGRIHTSTVTVAVLAEVDDVEIDIPDSDIEIDVYKSAGAGGQNVQKNMTAVRIHHKPTGIIVACQDERSQLQNRLRAMSVLKARLYEMEQEKRQNELDATRRSQIGSGERSEKIRTYNYPQSRVTDHRINVSSYNIAGVMEGYELDTFIEELQNAEEAERLANFETND